MRRRACSIALLLAGCGGSAQTGADGPGPSVQAPIETACTDDSRPVGDFGLVANSDFSTETQATVVLSNVGAEKHRVAPRGVAICRGPCGDSWARCTDHRRFTPAERARYEVTLAPKESIELLVDARIDQAQARCEKVGLYLIVGVDQVTACTDVGTWIATSR
jgi:hypothetical protein